MNGFRISFKTKTITPSFSIVVNRRYFLLLLRFYLSGGDDDDDKNSDDGSYNDEEDDLIYIFSLIYLLKIFMHCDGSHSTLKVNDERLNILHNRS